MKKYEGGPTWYETVHYFRIDEGDIQWAKENGDPWSDGKPGDTVYYLPTIPFGDWDNNSVCLFDVFYSGWEDKNLFITDTEVYNWFKRHRI